MIIKNLSVQGTLKSLLQHHNLKISILWHSAFFMVQLSHLYITTGKKLVFHYTMLVFFSNGLYSPWNSLGQNTGVGSLFPLQGIFPTQGLNPGLLHCRWMLCQLSHKGSPWMWEMDHKEGWVPKNWCFQTVVLEKTLESPLNCKEIKQVNPKRNQSWVFIGRTDAESEAPIL